MVRLGQALLRLALERPKLAVGVCIAFGLCLLAPGLGTDWVADDLLHQLMLRPEPGIAGLAHQPLDLFRFASGDPHAARLLTEQGVFAWWTDPQARLAFFRPLSCLTHWLDYQLWPQSPVWMHVHSLAWFALLLAVLDRLYRCFAGGPGAPALALLLFAIDDAHAPVVSWIANRNQLIALTLALPALLLHHRFRSERWRPGAWLGPGLFALGLLAGEAAMIAGAYLFAYATVMDRGSRLQRCASLLPYVAVVLVWRAAYQVLGYGAENSGLYADPVRAPLAFLGAVLQRLPVLGLSQLALPWADLWEVYPLTFPWLRHAVAALAWVVLLAFMALLRPLWRESRVMRFWSLGALLALIPVCASFPHDRLLLGSGIGVMALIAELLRRAFLARASLGNRLVLGVLGGLHLLLAPVLLPVRAALTDDFNRLLAVVDRSIPSGPDIADKCVVLVNPPIDPLAAYFPIYRQARGQPRPRQMLWLNTGVTELSITGVDASSLRVRAKGGFLSSSSQLMLRDPKRPPRRGETIELSFASIRVLESTADGRPLEIMVRFHEALSNERLLFLEWKAQGYVGFVPPAAGQSITVPAVDLIRTLFG